MTKAQKQERIALVAGQTYRLVDGGDVTLLYQSRPGQWVVRFDGDPSTGSISVCGLIARIAH